MSAPPGLTAAAARASSRACRSARRGTSAACRRQRRSAREASVPRPLHGRVEQHGVEGAVPVRAAARARRRGRRSTPFAPRRARLARSSPRARLVDLDGGDGGLRAAAPPAGSSWRRAPRRGPGRARAGPGHAARRDGRGDLRAARLRRHQPVAEGAGALERRALVEQRVGQAVDGRAS